MFTCSLVFALQGERSSAVLFIAAILGRSVYYYCTSSTGNVLYLCCILTINMGLALFGWQTYMKYVYQWADLYYIGPS